MSDAPLPAVFVGHGNPMNAIAKNAYTDAWATLGKSLPRPRAILAVSAHWYVTGTRVTAMEQPRTIHDFGGFPRELYEVAYPAAGDPALAARVRDLLAPVHVELDERWGLDHGTWSVLVHLFPGADVPVVQLSIDETQDPDFHFELGKRLGALRDEGVFLFGSGNLVHNLHAYAWGRHDVEAYDWAERFETRARAYLEADDPRPLVEIESLGRDAVLAAPTPDHYLPFLYVLGARRKGEAIRYPVEGFDGGSISMLAVRFG
ncbi:MAG: 4,5-DOPA dioxygenase extradiol [Candidatus Eiseniibacteriota bacterium]